MIFNRIERYRRLLILSVFVLQTAAPVLAADVRVGVLKFGTVNWELDVVQRNGLDRAAGIELEVAGMASNQATAVALQAGAVDVIVTDWLWVSRQRQAGSDYSFVPYSTAVGALVVSPQSGITGIEQLGAKRIGIGGGALDKSWMLLRAVYAQRGGGEDLKDAAEPVFGAPPLINQQLLSGQVDGVVNYWHYAARLEASGMKRVAGVEELLSELGVRSAVPFIGYVFSERWASAQHEKLEAFLSVTAEAKRRLCSSDEEWRAISPLVKAENEAISALLRQRYCEGIVAQWGAAEREDAARVYQILRQYGGEALVGPGATLAEGTFWEAHDR